MTVKGEWHGFYAILKINVSLCYKDSRCGECFVSFVYIPDF